MRPDRTAELRALLQRRILILDGAMGTMIQGYKLDEAPSAASASATTPSDLKGNNDLLTLTQPQIIREIHEGYLEAGADIDRDQHLQLHPAVARPTTAWSRHRRTS